MLRDLDRQALVASVAGRYALSAAGEATRARIAEDVNVTRRRLVDGVSQEEYRATVGVLQRMTANLER